MSVFYSYQNLKNGGTFKLASTTATSIAADPKSIVGKVVTITGNYEVGYGSAGDRPLGFVEQIEKETSNSSSYVVSVIWNTTQEGITCVGSETAGAYLACDGTGGVKISGTSSAPIVSNAVAYGVDATAKTVTVYIHG